MIPTDTRFYTVNNHGTNAFQVMYELRQKCELCDIVLCVEQHEFQAHKVVLAGCSPYLRAMFTNGMLETEKNKVVIHGIEPVTMELLLDFMYKGSIELTVDNVQFVLQGASMLNITSLRNICSQFLHLHLDATNSLGIQSLADMFSCNQLETAARHYIHQHFQDIAQHDEFFQMSESKLVDLLRSDQLHVENEKDVFEAAMSWIEYDYEQRSVNACRILTCIRLALLEVAYLENIVLQIDVVRNCPKCQHLVAKAMQIKSDNNALSQVFSRAQPPCVVVVGGRNSVDCQLKSVERYDILRDQWIPMGNMLTARTAVGSATLNGWLYGVGGECALTDGQDNTLFLQTLECYDPVLREWIGKASMKMARSFVSVAVCGNFLYAIGGEDRTTSYNVVERYDWKQDSWAFVSSMQKKRSGSGVAVCDSRIYIAGGFDKDFHADRASIECYDPETQDWTLVAEMEKARSGLVLVSIDYCIYAIGGRSRHNDQYFDLIERYNTITHQWTTLESMHVPRAWPSAAVFENKIFIMGGFDGTSRLRSVECYDPHTDTWTFLSNMNVNRAGCGAAVI